MIGENAGPNMLPSRGQSRAHDESEKGDTSSISQGVASPVTRKTYMHAKILIVEDHSDCREMLGLQLRHIGYETIEAASGPEAIEKALTENPDIVVMDLGLPGLNGIEATSGLGRILKRQTYLSLRTRLRTIKIPKIAL